MAVLVSHPPPSVFACFMLKADGSDKKSTRANRLTRKKIPFYEYFNSFNLCMFAAAHNGKENIFHKLYLRQQIRNYFFIKNASKKCCGPDLTSLKGLGKHSTHYNHSLPRAEIIPAPALGQS
ncbi:hypothetical protein [Iodidimonas nitroreducens]|uniref:hypothetical protein n=1 Tax=Iodidimonas nitroreducens TaxID=1236968 RepID=UPI001230C13C|nr:hypothetical protein [Iodidimonas nitroreducens]